MCIGVVLFEICFWDFVLLVLFSFICLVLSGVYLVSCFFEYFFLDHCNEVCPTSDLLDKLILFVVQCLLTSFFLRTWGDVMLNKDKVGKLWQQHLFSGHLCKGAPWSEAESMN